MKDLGPLYIVNFRSVAKIFGPKLREFHDKGAIVSITFCYVECIRFEGPKSIGFLFIHQRKSVQYRSGMYNFGVSKRELCDSSTYIVSFGFKGKGQQMAKEPYVMQS